MMFPIVMDIAIPVLFLLLAVEMTTGLRDVRVTIPAAVRKGENVDLLCSYDLEGDTLYSIKWYKGKREFYRYTPKENPAMKTFPSVAGILVEMSLSNQSHVVLTSVEPTISGKFSCEVSADAPSFHTMLVSGDMEIVETPDQKPIVNGVHIRYRPGDVVRGNCSSYYSKPAANLTWTINDVPAPITHLKSYPAIKDLSNFESTTLGINFQITHEHFIKGKLKLRCLAKMYDIYLEYTDKFIEEDRPRILATGSSSSNNNNNNMRHSSVYEGEMSDQDELYLTHYKADLSSSSGVLIKTYIITGCWITFYICTVCTILLYSLRVGIS